MRLGAVFPQAEFDRVDPDEIVGFVQRLEAAGYDHLLAYDHVLGADSRRRPGWTGAYDHEDPFLEPLVLFGYLARACSMEFVTGVLVLPQRQTALVAKQVSTLELLAPGRLRLGVGIGWNDVEYHGLDVDFASRASRIEEQIGLLRRLWSEPVLDHTGPSGVIDAAGIAPLPARVTPIWIGSGPAPKALARVGRFADGWLPMPGISPGRGLEEAFDIVTAAAREAGRDPAAIGLEPQLIIRDDPGRFARSAARWQDAGVDTIAVNTLRFGRQWPQEHLDALLLAADILRG
jgi:probable F420-dependent oxidoreductase